MKEFWQEKWRIVVAVILVLALVAVSFWVSFVRQQKLADARQGRDRKIPIQGGASENYEQRHETNVNEYDDMGNPTELILGREFTKSDQSRDAIHKAYVTYVFFDGHSSEETHTMPAEDTSEVQDGDELNIVNPVFEGYRTSWPEIHLDKMTEDRNFFVRYYKIGVYSEEFVQDLAEHRVVLLACQYNGTGLIPNPPLVADKFGIGDEYTYDVTNYEGFRIGMTEIKGKIGTDSPPEDYIVYRLDYEWDGSSDGEPFPYPLMVFYRFSSVGCTFISREPDVYWFGEGKYVVDLPQITWYSTEKQQLRGTMESGKTTVVVADYHYDESQQEGELPDG